MAKVTTTGTNVTTTSITTTAPDHHKNVLIRKNLIIVIAVIVLIQFVWYQSKNQQHVFDTYYKNDHVGVVVSHHNDDGTTTTPGMDYLNVLSIPKGEAVALPSIRVSEITSALSKNNVDKKRSIYGGKGDKVHLGGFTEIDIHGISPAVWKYMVSNLGVHSILDVGCGRGISTTWFHYHGLDTLCVEGSHDAVLNSMLPNVTEQVVEHDYSRGPYWPKQTYDAVWAVEFLEHVGVPYHFNYIATFRKAALLFVTSSRWGGWHHVEVHPDDWWIRKYELYGFKYDPELTKIIRSVAGRESSYQNETSPNGEYYNAQHVRLSMKVFINPVVASLPQHAHLFPEHGCYGDRGPDDIIHRVCGTGPDGELETPLPPGYWPLVLNDTMDELWQNHVKQFITVKK